MPDPSETASASIRLDGLRAEIDRIDAELHRLIKDRAEVAMTIKEVKGDAGPVIRPAREADLLRERAAAHDGPLPFIVIGRIWRELISAMTVLQAPLSVAVLAPETRRGYWDIARDHFGSVTTLLPQASAVAVLRAVADGGATMGVLPVPEEDDADSWWTVLVENEGHSPHIVAKLPFIGRGNARSESRGALAIAMLPPAPTGADRSYLALTLEEDLSRGGFKSALEAGGLTPTAFLDRDGNDQTGPVRHLVEVDGFVAADDDRITRLPLQFGEKLLRCQVLGAYPVPPRQAEEKEG